MGLFRNRVLRFLGAVFAFALFSYEAMTATGLAAEMAKGSLRIAAQPAVQTDPAFISSDTEVAIANSVYDYLVDVGADNNIKPRLATAWDVSGDRLTYTFTLAKGVTFHDGSPLIAEDVVWTFNRLRDPDLGSPTVNLYSNIESIRANGNLKVIFNLKESNPFFLFDLSDNHALVIKNGTTKATDFNGSGPFKVTNYSAEDRIEMVANPNYFIEDMPRLEELEFIFFNDQAAAIDALRSGQVDLAWRMSNALFLSLQGERGLNSITVPTNGFDLVRLRSDQPPGNNPLVVKALKLATDRKAIFEATQLGFGAIGRDSPIGPLYTSYYSERAPLPARDVRAAKALLAEAGYANGLRLELHTPDSGGRPDVAVILKEQWAEVGVEVAVIVEPESVYYGENKWLEATLGITGWGSRPIPQFYLDVMLVCGAKWNESKFCDSEFDDLARIAGSTLNEAVRKTAYEEIQRILIDRGPVIIPYFFATVAVISDRFEGLTLKAFPGRTDLRTVGLK